MDMMASTFVKADNTLFGSLFFLSTFISLFLLFIISKTKASKSIENLPPSPPQLPIIGNLHQVGNNPIVSTAILARQYGPLISLRLGQQLLVVASSPEAAMGILKTQDRFLSSRPVPAAFNHKKYAPHSLVWAAECNQTWKNLRTLCRTHLFSVKALESHSRLRAEKVSWMVDFLRRKQGQVIDVEDVVFTTLYNTLSSIVFGKDMLQFDEGDGTTRDPHKESVRKIIEYGSRVKDFGMFYPRLDRFDLHGTKKGSLKEFDRLFGPYWDCLIEEIRAVVNSSTWSSDQAQCFLDLLLENEFTNYQIYQFVLELFIAGSNTTTSAIVWAMTELLRHNEVLSKLDEELQKEIKSDQINVSQLSELTYLQSCIKETYRLHPSVPLLLPRVANETCEVMNYTIPKNAMVFVNIWAMGRDPELWREPLRYMPKRFTESKLDFKGQDFKFIPFGSGRRICAGMPSGIKSVEYILATLVREFSWTLPNGDDPSKLDLENKMGVAMRRVNPLKLIFKQK
ncbi:putative (S)-N-methylcoclaurine 3'-hydroxylase isozyme 2 [Bidens hawaiensis]|uniref:putative (S)-N-methylcoclaurine 3'-hydroxylase isozyme 2 n=1 Tax=Bidens hawaiensis TaxID=980011 RepID=UPI00404B62BF